MSSSLVECCCTHCNMAADPRLDDLCAFCFVHCIGVCAGATSQQLLLAWVHDHNAHFRVRVRQERLLQEVSELHAAFLAALR